MAIAYVERRLQCRCKPQLMYASSGMHPPRRLGPGHASLIHAAPHLKMQQRTCARGQTPEQDHPAARTHAQQAAVPSQRLLVELARDVPARVSWHGDARVLAAQTRRQALATLIASGLALTAPRSSSAALEEALQIQKDYDRCEEGLAAGRGEAVRTACPHNRSPCRCHTPRPPRRYAPDYDSLDGGSAASALGFDDLRDELLSLVSRPVHA